ncbi:DNA-binding protein YbiB [Chitinimonas taiwanensis]|uniref:Anthranilate phosphoribosyltransferase n=1 Tax=Chitinimonas taiwanensis DSM 18899 TaxID=1121279 RepID=A0A1K2HRL0_9NEIS|nr:DNA-binding protein YbiB [Chitinimonas taiwanensis]SFZ79407.1 Anthranilate phosphoribosyltransferase [Chitinimonas taiwanensis DSM 18899]
MSYTRLLKAIATSDPRHLSQDEARELFAAMLDGGIPDLELGALLLALRVKGECSAELDGATEALASRTLRLAGGAQPAVVLPSYGGARHFPNLTPLLALLLRRFNIPVLIHGELDGHGRVASAMILRELGIMPTASLARAEAALARDGLAFLPVGAFSPGLAGLLALRARLGVRHLGHQVAKLLQPFDDARTLTVIGATHADRLEHFRQICLQRRRRAMLLMGTEGEPFADPRHRPEIDLVCDGEQQMLFRAENSSFSPSPTLPAGLDASATARWIEAVLAGDIPLPTPLVNQLACCLYGIGYVDDMNQAKAIVAVEVGMLAQRKLRAA